MKKFEAPEIEMLVFKMEDILDLSDTGDDLEPGQGGIGGGMEM